MQPHSPRAKFPRFNRASRFEAGRSSAVLLFVIVVAVGCGDKLQPAAAIPPCPPTTFSTMRQPRKTFSDPILQRLSKAGALIDDSDAHEKDGRQIVMIFFRDTEIDTATTENLARLCNPGMPTRSNAPLADRPIHLVFERCRVNDKVISAMNGAARLDGLSFIKTQVDDAMFADVEAMPALRDLNIDDSQIG